MFRADKLRKQAELFTTDDDNEEGYYMGALETADAYRIGLFYYKIKHGSVAHKKVGLRNLVRRFINENWGEFDAAIVVFDDNSEWRLSFVCDIKDVATTPKRFTYVFGEHDNFYRTPISRFMELQTKEATFENIREAFSVDALSNDFFDEYRELYADFVQYITGKRYVKESGGWVERQLGTANYQYSTTFGEDDKLVRDYVKKMFGRIVFLYFLQRKGWLNNDRQYMHNLYYNSDKKDNFLDGVLEALFFEVLNTDKNQRTAAAKALPGYNNIPYLNGGLFAQDDIDALDCVFPEDYFKSLFDFLDSYNFTIDENDVEDAEIGIDPEMLGRIFENLLEDNKDKGAFYTPKEIVNYMCREAIISYLQNDIPERAHSLIRKFVETSDAEELDEKQRVYLHNKLLNVKICDPAIGSGAFPMGMVNILSRLYASLNVDNDTSKLKREIMQKCIYGVDIERGAVDIARLRFWLAMIVEEKEPSPLPNLHFKIMHGNSLLEEYRGIDLSDLTKVNAQRGLWDSSNSERESLRKNLKEYYYTSDHAKRDGMFKNIISNVHRQLMAKEFNWEKYNFDPSDNNRFFLWHTWFSDIFENGGFDIVIGNPPYIQLQKATGRVVYDKKGKATDEKLGDLYINSGFETFERTGDIYCLFYEQGIKLLKPKGALCYITSNKWMRAGYGESTREFFAKKTNPIKLIDLSGVKIFNNATVDVNILLLKREENTKSTIACKIDCAESVKNLSDFVQQQGHPCSFSSSDSWVILSPIEQSIKQKIEAVGTPLKDWDIQINYGIKTGFNDAFIIPTEKRDEILNNCATEDERERTAELIRPILRGRDIKRYGYDWANLWLIATFPSRHYDIEEYPAVKDYLLSFGIERLEQTGETHIVNGEKVKARKKTSNKWFEVQDSISYWEDFFKPKIIWGEISDKPKFAFDFKGLYTPEATSFYMKGELIEFLFGALNSFTSEWMFSKVGTTTGVGTIRWKKYTIEQLLVAKPTQKQLTDYINKFNRLKSGEICIDEFKLYCNELMYKLYGLNEDEINIVENLYV
jgi:type I restriction-modification system DNA methylase subunit